MPTDTKGMSSNQLRQKLKQAVDEELGTGNTPDWLVDAILQAVIESLPEPYTEDQGMDAEMYASNGALDKVKTILTEAMSIGGDDE